jgi:hypothetical protein
MSRSYTSSPPLCFHGISGYSWHTILNNAIFLNHSRLIIFILSPAGTNFLLPRTGGYQVFEVTGYNRYECKVIDVPNMTLMSTSVVGIKFNALNHFHLGVWSASRPDRFNHRGYSLRNPLQRRPAYPQSRSEWVFVDGYDNIDVDLRNTMLRLWNQFICDISKGFWRQCNTVFVA